ncbi:MAG TPA: flavin reductase family protein, partial [Clostridiales bacterium]|nr:flavin reductase family protein [Clostridiales bacterium]
MAFVPLNPGTLLAPNPVVLVSAVRAGERPNLITVAWAGIVCSKPPMVSISVKPERYSHELITQTGEFVINLVSEDMVRWADLCGVKSGRD